MSFKKKKIFPYHEVTTPLPSIPCIIKDCSEKGEYRVLMDIKHPQKKDWMCLKHIKERNEKYNYFKGMDSSQIEHEIQADFLWRRPTWPLDPQQTTGSTQSKRPQFWFEDPIHDPFNLFTEELSQKDSFKDKVPLSAPKEIRDAAVILGVQLPITQENLKKAYKLKVKTYHPDVNGGSKEAEEKLKAINLGYKILEKYCLYS